MVKYKGMFYFYNIDPSYTFASGFLLSITVLQMLEFAKSILKVANVEKL